MASKDDIATALAVRRRRFLARGIAFASASGVCYGLYTAFLTLAQTQGVWGEWVRGWRMGSR